MSWVTVRRFRLVLLALLASVVASSSSSAQLYKDERLGFSLRIPKDYEQVPTKSSEEYVVAHFVSKKETFLIDKSDGFSWVHRPDIQVIAFLDAVINRPQIEEDEDDAEKKVRVIDPYRDYKDFMNRTYPGGFFFDIEEEDEHKGLPVKCYEIKVESKTGGTAPKRLLTWVFRTELGEIAVQCESLVSEFDKFQSEFKKLIRSFTEIERTEELDLEAFTGGFISLADLDELTPDQRRLQRIELERRAWERATRDLPDGWETYEMDGVMCMTRADKGYSKKVIESVFAVTDFLEETFPDVGKGEYTRTPMLRICKDDEEYFSLYKVGSTWDFTDLSNEIVTYKTKFGATSVAWETVKRRAMEIWFSDRDRDLYFALPEWLRRGLRETIEGSDMKGSKLKLEGTMAWKNALRDAERDDRLVPVKDLMHMTRRELYTAVQNDDWGPLAQCVALVDMLINSKKRNLKTVLADYMKHVDDITAEIRAENVAKRKAEQVEDSKPTTEEEEDEYFRKEREAIEAQQERLLSESFIRTFDGWSEKEWSSFERAFQKSL